MPLPTSDFHNPICLEMRSLNNGQNMVYLGPPPTQQPYQQRINEQSQLQQQMQQQYHHHQSGHYHPPAGAAPTAASLSYGHSTITLPIETPLRQASFSNNNNNNNSNYNAYMSYNSGNINNNNHMNADLASVDSSDTYASCQTHPFLSQGDLTSDLLDDGCALDIDMNNLYINPLVKEGGGGEASAGAVTISAAVDAAPPTSASASVGAPAALAAVRPQVKKSASGDTGLRSLGASPMDDGYQNFQVFDAQQQEERGSHISLNESPVPKHRKTRFQQSTKPRARFEDVKSSQESLSDGKKNRRSSFMPAKSLASATKLINQHLFGIQSSSSSKGEFQFQVILDYYHRNCFLAKVGIKANCHCPSTPLTRRRIWRRIVATSRY